MLYTRSASHFMGDFFKPTQETEGAKYQGKALNRKKKLYYGVLRIIIRPLRLEVLEDRYRIITKNAAKLFRR